MGDDKGLLLFKNETWAELAYKKVSALNPKTVVSIDPTQFQNYSPIFLRDDLITDNAGLALAGPLLGIASVHCRFPREDLLVLACDMPAMQAVVLENLLRQYNKNCGDEVIAYRFGEQVEPLCSVYAAEGLAKILDSHWKKNLVDQSMMHVLETLQTRYIVPEASWRAFFRNMNSRSDLADK